MSNLNCFSLGNPVLPLNFRVYRGHLSIINPAIKNWANKDSYKLKGIKAYQNTKNIQEGNHLFEVNKHDMKMNLETPTLTRDKTIRQKAAK